VNVREADLAELRRRMSATKWPERETVGDAEDVCARFRSLRHQRNQAATPNEER